MNKTFIVSKSAVIHHHTQCCWCIVLVIRSAVVQWRHWAHAWFSTKLLLALLLGFRFTASYSGRNL